MSGISSKGLKVNKDAERLIRYHSIYGNGKRWIYIKYPEQPFDKEYRIMQKLKSFRQEKPPKRGTFTNGSDQEVEKGVAQVTNKVMKAIKSKGEMYAEYLNGEETQIGAKGPVVIAGDECLEAYDKLAANSAVQLVEPKNVKLIDDIINQTVTSSFKGKEGFEGGANANFDHAQAGEEMTGSTLRGLPFDQQGNEITVITGKKDSVDAWMVLGLGKSTTEVLNKVRQGVEKISEISPDGFLKIAITRNRLQSPNKFRIVSVVPAPLQYLKFPFVSSFMDAAKRVAGHCAGGLPPAEREKRIKDMCNLKFKNRKLSEIAIPFSIDFSKFDQRQDLDTMEKANLAAGRMKGGDKNPVFNKVQSILEFVESKKTIVRPGRSFPIAVQGAKNLLDSGDVDTSSKGTNMSRTYSCGILMHLDQPKWFYDKTLNLGDDTVLGLLKSTVKSLGGIKATNENIAEYLSRVFGTVLNVDKQLPVNVSPAFEYLQRFYLNQKGLMGLYSINRAVGSLAGTERYQAEIKGIRNIPALQMIGQISTLNETVVHPETSHHNDEIVQGIVLDEGLKADIYLANLIRIALEKQHNTREASILWFYYLCAAAGGLRPVVRDNGGLGGAQTNQQRLNQYSADKLLSSLPILDMMTSIIQTNGVKSIISESQIMEFFNTKTKIVKTNSLYNELLNHGFSV